MRSSPVVLLPLLVLATAGCLGGATGEEAPAPGADGLAPAGAPPAGASPGGAWQSLQLPGSLNRVAWTEEGTFALQDHGAPVGHTLAMAGMPRTNRHSYDLTTDLPQGMPVRITAQVDAAMTRGDMDLWLNAGENEFWTGDWDAPRGGYTRFEAVVVRDTADPVVVVVQYDEVEPGPAVAYTLAVEVVADPSAFPVGLPYGILAPPGTLLRLSYAHRDVPGPDRAPSEVLLWGPDDAPLLRASFVDGAYDLVLPEAAPGEYVLAFRQGRGDVAIQAQVPAGAEVAIRRLGATLTMGDPVVLPPGQEEVAWTFDVRQPPLLVGFFTMGEPLVSSSIGGRLVGPGGEVLFEFAATDGPFLMPGFGADTGYGAPGVVPGAYAALATFGHHAGQAPPQVAHYVIGWQR
jgi:hypothetical protein